MAEGSCGLEHDVGEEPRSANTAVHANLMPAPHPVSPTPDQRPVSPVIRKQHWECPTTSILPSLPTASACRAVYVEMKLPRISVRWMHGILQRMNLSTSLK